MLRIDRLLGSLCALALVLVGTPMHSRATCAAPGPERPRLITPAGWQVPAGSAFVMFLSDTAIGPISLRARNGPSVQTTRELIAPHVVRVIVPATAAPGRYEVTSTIDHRAVHSGPIEIVVASASRTPITSAPVGTLRNVLSHNPFHGDARDLTLHLATPPTEGVGVVASWSGHGQAQGSIVWMNAQTSEVSIASSGGCGGFPYGVVFPHPRTSVRVAFVSALGELGPWANITAH